jgi:hypothetical protein
MRCDISGRIVDCKYSTEAGENVRGIVAVVITSPDKNLFGEEIIVCGSVVFM